MSDTSHDRPPRVPRGIGPLKPEMLDDPHEAIQRNWGWILAVGIALILGGIAALLLPFFAGIAVTAAVGVAFAVAGALQLVHVFGAEGWRARAWSGVSGLVYLLGGLLILFNPLAGLVALTLVMAATFLVEGVFRIAMGIGMRPERGWGWMLAGGVATLLLALAIIALWPAISGTLIGILVAVSLILEGWGCVFLALAARRAGSGGGEAEA